jgi:hypothetical protein
VILLRRILWLLTWAVVSAVAYVGMFLVFVFGDCFDDPCRQSQATSFTAVFWVSCAIFCVGWGAMILRWHFQKVRT